MNNLLVALFLAVTVLVVAVLVVVSGSSNEEPGPNSRPPGTDFRLEFDGDRFRCVGVDCNPALRDWITIEEPPDRQLTP